MRVPGNGMFAAHKPDRRGLYPFSLSLSLSLTNTADRCGSETEAVALQVSLGRLIPGLCVKPAIASGVSS